MNRMRFFRRRIVYFLVLLALSSRIKTSHGVKEKEVVDEEKSPPSFTGTARGGVFNSLNTNDEHRYIVKFKSDSGFKSVRYDAQIDGTHIMELERETTEVMTLRTLDDVQRMEERNDVEYVERDRKVYLQQSDTRPYGVRMVKAFAVSADFISNQKVCIIDSGYERSHPDLPVGSGRIRGSSNGAGSWFKDGDGHGTHVAGVIVAMENNDGIVGINQGGDLKLHIVRVFGNNGQWAWGSSLVAAANECVDNGSTVINMSLGGPDYSQFERDAFQKIYDNNVLLVAAGGNDGSNTYLYPAAYTSVIGVAAVNKNKKLASFSQRNNRIDLAAPGVGIKSTVPSGGYEAASGTSMACPHVSGVAALVWSHFPEKTAQEIREALEESAEDRGPAGKDNKFGHGIVNAKRAFDYLADNCIETCANSPLNWYDSDGEQYDCEWYSADQNCELYGSGYENFGKTANKACCACGGGETTSTCSGDPPTVSPTESPTESPTMAPTITPVARPTMATNPTTQPTRRMPTMYPMRSPTESPTKSPTISPTAYPTKYPTETPVRWTDSPTTYEPPGECKDEPIGWYDADGAQYNCEWYGKPGENRCSKFGDLYENFGKTAFEACCVCGGGSNPCEDVEDWHDADGEEFNCDWYSEFDRCEKYGDLFENEGYTANEACCTCKTKLYGRSRPNND